jgi:hypothetical protein
LAIGDVEAIVGAELDGYFREPAGGDYFSMDGKVANSWTPSRSGGIGLEHCTVTDDGGLRHRVQRSAIPDRTS